MLVHGACHGAWCWNAVISGLERDGHVAVAVDLPSDRAELHLPDDVTVVHDALDRLDEPAVLVAHSLGAVTATAACHQRTVAGLVFVAGVVPSGWPSVPIRSIVCAQDRIVNPPWSRRIARDRLGVEPEELAGSHSPMLSRPAELAALLTRA